jgi:hypothetical protein
MHERLRWELIHQTSPARTTVAIAKQQPTVTKSPRQRRKGNNTPTTAAPPQSLPHVAAAASRGAAAAAAHAKVINKAKKLSRYRPVLVADPGASLRVTGNSCEKITLLVRIADVCEGWVTILPLSNLLAYCEQRSEPPPVFYRGGFGAAGKALSPLAGRVFVEAGGLAWLTLVMSGGGGGCPASSLYAPGGTLMAVCLPVVKPPLPRFPVTTAAGATGARELSSSSLPVQKVAIKKNSFD